MNILVFLDTTCTTNVSEESFTSFSSADRKITLKPKDGSTLAHQIIRLHLYG
jgi:hypothetical protein